VALVWGLAISRPWRTLPTAIERPNVLVVTVSSLRADRVFGDAARGETWERLSAEGTRFERVLAASPDTAQAARQWFGVAPSGTSWVEAFAAEGYRTAAFVGADATGRAAGLSSGFAVFDDDHGWPKGVEAVLAGRLLQRLGSEGTTARRGDRVTDRAVRFLSRQRGAWLCWVHLEDPTAPYVPPHPFDERFYLGDDPTDPGARTLTAGDPIDAAHAGTLRGIRDAAYVEARYDGEVAWTGRQIARLLEALDDLGMASTTVVAVVGLHGENLRESSTWFGRDGSLTGPALHVPAWLRWPGRVPVARRVVAPAELGDVAATLLDLVPWLEDAAPPGAHSFRPVWMGEPAPREVAQAERTTAEGSETATLTSEGISQQLPGGARVWWPLEPGSP
jgi:arylsulfatase A-like enzyme